MRALRSTRGQIHLDPRTPEPEPAPGEAVVRVLRAAISPLDLATARGHVPHEGTLGHECVGIVERLGPDAPSDAGSLVGARVVIQPEIVCASCDLCRAGLSRHCRARQMLGIGGRAGCIAERVAAPIRNLTRIPDSIDPDIASLAEPLACAMHASQIVRIVGKTYITVLGDEPHALLVAQVMARENASVRVLGERPERFGIAEKWGVKHRHVSEVGRRADQDVVVCAAPSPAMLDMATALVRPRGKVVLLGGVAGVGAARGVGDNREPHTGVDLAPVVESELEIVGARGGRLADAVAALEQRRYDLGSLITRRFKLDDAVGALRAASEPDALKVVVEC
ncbi:MAG: alcohol dehydrogenase catalytic domain-containing protein [Phycisphaeraceae bacterium]|nr:alcohol dehydrogenase catalytic domain-containing protein [Phycisphaeraceae bacterium]